MQLFPVFIFPSNLDTHSCQCQLGKQPSHTSHQFPQSTGGLTGYQSAATAHRASPPRLEPRPQGNSPSKHAPAVAVKRYKVQSSTHSSDAVDDGTPSTLTKTLLVIIRKPNCINLACHGVPVPAGLRHVISYLALPNSHITVVNML